VKTVSLVLGTGGARGLAHIGVIRWLEEHDYRIRHIAGASIGAVIGGIHAAGKLNAYEQWVRAITRMDILTYLDVAWGKGGFVKGDRIMNALIDLVGDIAIEDLPMRFTAVATDLEEHKEVWFTSGRLFDAIRASMSVPLLFTPFRIGGVDYVDGGVLNPVPVAPVMGDDSDLIVAVHFGGMTGTGHPERVPQKKSAGRGTTQPPADAASSEAGMLPDPASLLPTAIQQRIRQFMQKLHTPEEETNGRDWGTYEVAIQSFEAMQNSIAQQKLAAYPPDVLVELPRNACRTLEYDRAADMIRLGYETTAEVMDASTA